MTMSDKRLAEIRARLANWPRGYWLAGENNASLMQNGDERREIAVLSAEHSSTTDLLTHAYADMQELFSEIERLRAREEVLREVADGDVYHDSKGGMLIVAAPDALLAKVRALLGDEAQA